MGQGTRAVSPGRSATPRQSLHERVHDREPADLSRRHRSAARRAALAPVTTARVTGSERKSHGRPHATDGSASTSRGRAARHVRVHRAEDHGQRGVGVEVSRWPSTGRARRGSWPPRSSVRIPPGEDDPRRSGGGSAKNACAPPGGRPEIQRLGLLAVAEQGKPTRPARSRCRGSGARCATAPSRAGGTSGSPRSAGSAAVPPGTAASSACAAAAKARQDRHCVRGASPNWSVEGNRPEG
jgi:hypothetical protein